MKSSLPYMLSLALQRSFPRVFDYTQELSSLRRKGVNPRLKWPSWCAFPIGLALDVLRQHYGYDPEGTGGGVEPALLAALAGWRGERRMLRLTDHDLARAEEGPEWNEVPVSALFSLPWDCLYVEYPERVGALGAFIYLDWNGPGQESLVMLAHLEMYRVEPIIVPLPAAGKTMGGMRRTLERIQSGGVAGDDSRISDELFHTVMRMARANLGILSAACGVRDMPCLDLAM